MRKINAGLVFRNFVVCALILLSLLGVFLYHQTSQQSQIAARAAHSAILQAEHANFKAEVRSCQSFQALNNAKSGIVFSPPTKTGTAELYVIRFSKALDTFYRQSGCPQFLAKIGKKK